jgi:hypothetical protein
MCTYIVQPTQNRTSVRLGATPGGAAKKPDTPGDGLQGQASLTEPGHAHL